MPFRRRNKLVQPRLQLALVGSFVGLAALAMLMQFLLLGYRLAKVAPTLEGGGELMTHLPGVLLGVLAFSCAVVLPILFAVGILQTFRIAGPIYRFEQYFEALARGNAVGPCKLRDKDRLQSLCALINEATEPLRESAVGGTSEGEGAEVTPARESAA